MHPRYRDQDARPAACEELGRRHARGDVSTVFWLRPDQQLAILQVGRQVNPQKFGVAYEDLRRTQSVSVPPIAWKPLTITALTSSSTSTPYRSTTCSALKKRAHGAATISRPIVVPVCGRKSRQRFLQRDRSRVDRAECAAGCRDYRLLSQWLERPRRDFYVDLRGKYKACDDDRACDPIPVPERVRTDFLWQRSPFLLYGGGSGRVEGAGIDFILPYWMGRYYGLRVRTARRFRGQRRDDACPRLDCVAVRGGHARDGAQVSVVDSAGVTRQIKRNLLLELGPDQLLVPAGVAPGQASVNVYDVSGVLTSTSTAARSASSARVVHDVSKRPGPGRGAGDTGENATDHRPVWRFPVVPDPSSVLPNQWMSAMTGPCISAFMAPAFAAEARSRSASAEHRFRNVCWCSRGVRRPRPDERAASGSLRGKGEVDLVLTVDGSAANTVRIGIR